MIFIVLAVLWINLIYLPIGGFEPHYEVMAWSLFYALLAIGAMWEVGGWLDGRD